MTVQASLYAGVAAAFVLFVLAGAMESRRQGRRDIDAAGWVPWRGIQILAVFAALACLLVALHV